MKSVKEIRSEANMLYTKSSHYIVATFIVVGVIMAFASSLMSVLGVQFNLPLLFLAAVLFEPVQYGTIKASLLAYNRQARQVTTAKFSLLGFRHYFKIFLPFVGRSVFIYAIEALLIVGFCLIASQADHLMMFLEAVLGGQFDLLLSDGHLIVNAAAIVMIVITVVVGFVLESYLALSNYFAVDHEVGLIRSMRMSFRSMRGFFWDYIWLRITYLPYALATAIIAGVVSRAFTTMFQQLISMMPGVPILFFNILLVAIVAFINTLVSVMIYRVKENLAITVFYKELDVLE